MHLLKCRQPFFDDVVSGAKNFEVRLDDRGFVVGDRIDLAECDGSGQETGRRFCVTISYILRALQIPGYPLQGGYVVLGIRR